MWSHRMVPCVVVEEARQHALQHVVLEHVVMRERGPAQCSVNTDRDHRRGVWWCGHERVDGYSGMLFGPQVRQLKRTQTKITGNPRSEDIIQLDRGMAGTTAKYNMACDVKRARCASYGFAASAASSGVAVQLPHPSLTIASPRW